MPYNDILVRDILREHLSPVLDQPQYDRLQSKFLNELNLRDREINRLKAELEPLVRERITVEKMDEEIKSTVNELEEKISRLTASLAAALEKLRACVIHFERTLPSQPRPTISELENILKRDQICLTLIQPDGSLTSHPCIEEAKKVLSDPTGQAAFEKWKRMEAAIDTADKKLRSMHERIKKCTFKEVVVTEAFPIQFYDGYNEALVDVNNIIVEAIQALEGAGGGV